MIRFLLCNKHLSCFQMYISVCLYKHYELIIQLMAEHARLIDYRIFLATDSYEFEKLWRQKNDYVISSEAFRPRRGNDLAIHS